MKAIWIEAAKQRSQPAASPRREWAGWGRSGRNLETRLRERWTWANATSIKAPPTRKVPRYPISSAEKAPAMGPAIGPEVSDAWKRPMFPVIFYLAEEG